MLSATDEAAKLAELLESRRRRVVFAESCTCGLVAAFLGQIPGISQWFCGSTVTYRESTKTGWLDIDAESLARYSAESPETTAAMAQGVLQKTREAEIAFAITGHLGPSAGEKDGQVFLAFADRFGNVNGKAFQLASQSRVERQHEAARCLLQFAIEILNDFAPFDG